MKALQIMLLISSLSLWSNSIPPTEDVEGFAKHADQFLKEILNETMTQGAAFALVSKGKPVMLNGYGYADAAAKTKINKDTVFNIGSISKTVATWGVMHLVEQGRIDLDKPYTTYIKSWRLPDSEFDDRGVTVRRLLSHTAGLSVHGYPGFYPEDPRPSVKESLNGNAEGRGATDSVKIIMEPGTKWKYSGGGYTILQLMIEEISGQSFEDYMQQHIFKPLGMKHSSYVLPNHVDAKIAKAYGRIGQEIPLRRFTAQAAASLKVSLDDFVRFTRANIPVAQGGTGGGGVLSEKTIRSMWVAPPNSPEYALGYSIRKAGEKTIYGHGGDNYGWHAMLRVIPETGDAIILFTNSDNGPYMRGSIGCLWASWLSGDQQTCFKPSLQTSLIKSYIDNGIDGLTAQAHKQRKVNKERFHERVLNGFGYDLLMNEKVDDAVKVFELNVAFFPDAANPHDSLGEGYMTQKRYDLAIKHYQRSIELDPTNDHAKNMIKKMKSMK